MGISTQDIKHLREVTGAGMLDCKKALNESNGDIDASVDWLRKKGLAAAAKKSGRVASEGLIGVADNGSKAVLVEVNSETDFVARNEQFQTFVKEVASSALETDATIDNVLAAPLASGKSVEDSVKDLVGVIGENLQVRRSTGLEGQVIVTYLHNAVTAGLGKIGVAVALTTEGDAEKAKAFGKQVAMHIAATSPEALTPEDLDPKLVERERKVLTEQARASGKPDNVIEKMIEGRIRKFYAEVVLLDQAFVIDGKTPVRDALKEAEKEIGGATQITGYTRLTIGEGVEKKEEDFAAEVAAVAGGQ